MSLNAERFQTRGSRLAQLAVADSSEDMSFHSRKLGLNLSLPELGLSGLAINDLVDIYGTDTARAVARVGQQYMDFYRMAPDVPNLAEVIHRLGETYAMREVILKGIEPYDVLTSSKRIQDGMILH
jgi:hypothetical protein